jgi:hypothetical protein
VWIRSDGLEDGMQTGLDALALLMWSDVQSDW